MPKVPGLASAFEPARPSEASGVATIASRFDTQAESPPHSRVSDLASRFAGSDTPSPTPPGATPSPKPAARSPAPTPANTAPTNVSALSKAFSPTPGKHSAFSAAQSAFQRPGSSAGPADPASARVAGVARAFESRNTASAAPPRFGRKEERKEERMGERSGVEDKVDAFASVASRFETGAAGRKDDGGEEGEGAKERFRDAAKMFGGS